MKKITFILFLLFLIAVAINSFGQSTVTTGESFSLSVTNHVGNAYQWGLYLDDQAIVAANAANYTVSASGNTANFNISVAGTYYAIVMETDGLGCSTGRSLQITVLPNNSKVLYTSITSSACFQASNDFTIPVQFQDGSDLPLSAAHFPIVVSFQLNGVNQPTQTITFANQVLAISGSAFTANHNSDTPVTITITGATDIDNLNLQPETTSGQNIHTRTIFRQLTAPTVTALTTNDTTPAISGTATLGINETFTVSVNGFTYLPGEGNLILSGTNWTLQIPAARALPEGTFEILATVANAKCNLPDATTNELVIDTTNPTPLPSVVAQTTASATPLITGTATLASGEILTVTVNGVIYSVGDGHLSISGTVWSLQIPIANKLTVGVYPVIATVTDAAGNSSNDATTNELTIGASLITDRLATNDVNVTFKNRTVSGNVLINDAGFYGFNPTVGTIPELMPVHGQLSMASDGQYTYTPDNGFTGLDNFYYSVCTLEDPTDCDTVNVTIRVLEDNLALIGPVAMNDEVQAPVNTTVSGNVLANDLFPSGDQLVLNPLLSREPKHGKVVLERDGRFTYTPETGFTGQDNFIYEICGSILGLCETARVTITVSGDLTEVRLFDADDVYFANGKAINGNLIANDQYPATSNLSVTRTPVVRPSNGTVVINTNGTFVYTPTSGFIGTDHFVYELCEPQLKDCDLATVHILVKENPAQFADLSIVKSGPVSAAPGDLINYQLTVTNLGNAVAEKVQINDYLPTALLNPKFRLEGVTTLKDWSGYYPLDLLEVNKPFTLFIQGTVSPGAPDTLKNLATVNSSTWDPSYANNQWIVKTIIRRGPVARIQGVPLIAVGSCNIAGTVLDASKSGGDGLSFSWSPSVYLDNATSPTPRFTPGQTTRYLLTITDSKGLKDTTSVLVSVMPAPLAITDKNVFVDAPNTSILLNGAKSTGVGLTYLWLSKEGIILSGETQPTAMVSGLGMYYLQVTDALGCIAKDSVNVGIYIQAINDTASTIVNERVIINVLRNDIPRNAINPSSISIVTPPLHGLAMVSADSLIIYAPEESYIGQDEFIYQVCDYFQNCDNAKVLVFINDIPFFIPEAFSPNGDGINDKFEIKGLEKYNTVQIEIFNRWGNIVYQSNNYGNKIGQSGFWDGTVTNGMRIGSGPVPSGTYYYILTLNGKEKISKSFYLDR